ncbi:MAG: uroporphyrinogen decarboxylase family protein [Lachnospiraceae bacterium]|jgi:uroporphyrinogen decarboxylase
MNSLERVMTTLEHREADCVPVYPFINSISRNYLGIDYGEWSLDAKQCANSIIKATEDLDLDIVSTQMDYFIEAADWGMVMKYPIDQSAYPESKKVIQNMKDYDKIKILDPRKTPRMSQYIQLARYLSRSKGKEKFVMGYVNSPLGILSMLRGQEQTFRDILKQPLTVHKALYNITKTITSLAQELVQAGCHGIMFDTAYASDLIMDSFMWDEYEGQYLERTINATRETGAKIMIHNERERGHFELQVKRMKPDVLSFFTLPSDCNTMTEMKQKYGSRVTLMGHLDPDFFQAYSTEELREECREQIRAYKEGGGFILATGIEYPMNLEDTYARVIVEECRKYGVYKEE